MVEPNGPGFEGALSGRRREAHWTLHVSICSAFVNSLPVSFTLPKSPCQVEPSPKAAIGDLLLSLGAITPDVFLKDIQMSSSIWFSIVQSINEGAIPGKMYTHLFYLYCVKFLSLGTYNITNSIQERETLLKGQH